MPLRFLAVSFASQDPERVGAFWGAMLGRDPTTGAGGILLPGSATQCGLAFHKASRTDGPGRVHLHLTSGSAAAQRASVERAIGLGACHLDVGQRPEEGHIVLGDPDGNAFCVIEPHNNYLAGTGFLGELACDGTREVGLFWSAALDWPLVWDQDEETAIQSPVGGTKLAWGGPPVAPPDGGEHFIVTAVDPAREAERLSSLGAQLLAEKPTGAIELTDPDGTRFVLICDA